MSPEEIAKNVLVKAKHRQSERKRGSYNKKIPFKWDNVWGDDGFEKSIIYEIAEAIREARRVPEFSEEEISKIADEYTSKNDDAHHGYIDGFKKALELIKERINEKKENR